MESGYLQPACFAAQQLSGALLHFTRRFIGEGYRGNVMRFHATFTNQVGNFFRDNARFATAGASQHQQRRINVTHRFTLGRV